MSRPAADFLKAGFLEEDGARFAADSLAEERAAPLFFFFSALFFTWAFRAFREALPALKVTPREEAGTRLPALGLALAASAAEETIHSAFRTCWRADSLPATSTAARPELRASVARLACCWAVALAEPEAPARAEASCCTFCWVRFSLALAKARS